MRRHCNWMGRELGGISHLEQHFGRKGRRNRGFWGLGHRTSSTLMSVLFFYTRCFGRPPHASRVPWLGRSRPRCARRLDCHAHLTSAAIASALPSLPRRAYQRAPATLCAPAPCAPVRAREAVAALCTHRSLPPSLPPAVRAPRVPDPTPGGWRAHHPSRPGAAAAGGLGGGGKRAKPMPPPCVPCWISARPPAPSLRRECVQMSTSASRRRLCARHGALPHSRPRARYPRDGPAISPLSGLGGVPGVASQGA